MATGLRTVRRSRDLVTWEDTGRKPLTTEARQSLTKVTNNIWAPSVVKVGDKWLLYVSLFVSDEECYIPVLSADAPTGPFSYCGVVFDTKREGILNAIDPDVFVEGGQVWMFFGSLADGVHRVELAADGCAIKPGAKPVHVAGIRRPADKMVGAYEGSYVLKHDGWWDLFLSGGGFADGSYYLAVGRAKTLDGTFLDRKGIPLTQGKAEPILKSAKGDTFFGPGHNGDVFTDKAGRDWMFFHSHHTAYPKHERPTCLQELKWTPGGWPYLEGGKPQPHPITRPLF